MPTTFYFDTNVYRHISQCGEAGEVARLLRRRGVAVLASSSNLTETFAIRSAPEREREMRVLTAVATRFEHSPSSWHQALELQQAIRRHRKHWLRPIAFERRARFFLDLHRERWKAALVGDYPDAASYARFRNDFEEGVQHLEGFQKKLRLERLDASVQRLVVGAQADPRDGELRALDLGDPEVFWRAECLLAWSDALLDRNDSSRDLRDWLEPHLKGKAFASPDYPSFWLRDVLPQDVPRNRLAGLVSFHQLDRKVGHGNAEDAQHACHALDADFFFTADRAFEDALTKTSRHFTRFAKVVRADRGASSSLGYIEPILQALP